MPALRNADSPREVHEPVVALLPEVPAPAVAVEVEAIEWSLLAVHEIESS
jgi:hypothetical protein